MADSRFESGYIASTFLFDTQQLYDIDIKPELRELLVRLYQNLNIVAIAVNDKENGYYNTFEMLSGKQYFRNAVLNSSTIPFKAPDFHDGLRIVIDFGQLPNTATKSVAHELADQISDSWRFIGVTGTASDTTGLNYINLPYASPTLANNIELNADGTNVNVITGSNRTNFDVCFIELEYYKF